VKAPGTFCSVLSKIVSRLVMLVPHYEPGNMCAPIGEPRVFD
jgi:hypothetical protein